MIVGIFSVLYAHKISEKRIQHISPHLVAPQPTKYPQALDPMANTAGTAINGEEKTPPNKASDNKLRLQQQIKDAKAQLCQVEKELAKEEGFSSSRNSYKVLFFALLFGLSAWAAKFVWDSLLQYDFYYERQEYLFMSNMSSLTKCVLIHLPFLSNDARAALEAFPKSHKAHSELYDPTKHDTVYRSLQTNFLTLSECAIIRNVLEKQSLEKGTVDPIENSAVNLEMSHKSVFDLLSNEQDNQVTQQEKEVLRDVLGRVQAAAEEKFGSPGMIMEFSDITVRRSPVQGGISNSFRRLHYLTTGGHLMHADQCGTRNTDNPRVYTEGFVCEILKEHCCAHRTHSVLLYLNEPSDVVGGDLYLVDRQDLLQNDEPSYAGVGYAKQLQHTVRVQPTCGNLMLFTSDARNLHGTLPIVKGRRFAMPMWFMEAHSLPWHESEKLESHMETYFWGNFHTICEQIIAGDRPVPTGLREYVGGDCDEMKEAVVAMVYEDEDLENDEEEDWDNEEDDEKEWERFFGNDGEEDGDEEDDEEVWESEDE